MADKLTRTSEQGQKKEKPGDANSKAYKIIDNCVRQLRELGYLRCQAAGNSVERSLGAVSDGQQFGLSRRWHFDPSASAMRWIAVSPTLPAQNQEFCSERRLRKTMIGGKR